MSSLEDFSPEVLYAVCARMSTKDLKEAVKSSKYVYSVCQRALAKRQKGEQAVKTLPLIVSRLSGPHLAVGSQTAQRTVSKRSRAAEYAFYVSTPARKLKHMGLQDEALSFVVRYWELPQSLVKKLKPLTNFETGASFSRSLLKALEAVKAQLSPEEEAQVEWIIDNFFA